MSDIATPVLASAPSASPPSPGPLAATGIFLARQAYAALFGILFLIALPLSAAIWDPSWPLHRYDALFLFALGVQILMLALRLETPREALVIALFHVTGTAMEVFKTGAGSWAYPEAAIFRIEGVPLFTGFMYASVGSWIARSIRIHEMRFAPCPPYWAALALGAAIYANFFAHHYLPDMRWPLFAATLLLFWRTRAWLRPATRWRSVRLPLAALGGAFALWIAENVGTLSGTWIYAGQARWQAVDFSKFGSWYLLLYVAFVTVALVFRGALLCCDWRPGGAGLGRPPKEGRA